MTAWHHLDASAVAADLETDLERGLAEDEVARRRERHGPNALIESGARGPWRILGEQLRGAMIVLLVVAGAVSLALGERVDAAAIAAIVVLNALLGFVQDYRAERALAALKQLAVPTVRVRREGEVRELSARELVPGDLCLLEVGALVPSDGRVVRSTNLRVQEAALTGESEPVEKSSDALADEDPALGDRHNMTYMGTAVTYGHAEVLVTATGMETELGRIARSLRDVTAEPTPLQRRLARLGRTLALVALGIVAVVFVLGVLRGESPRLMLMTALSLAVAVVPEGLPAVATVALALGARRMFARKVLIRRLPAVETLGSVTVICSDKTGTLTENRMTVVAIDVAGERVDLGVSRLLHRGAVVGAPAAEEPRGPLSSAQALTLAGSALCNDAVLQVAGPGGQGGAGAAPSAIGDPTEAALVVAAARLGGAKPGLEAALPRVLEVPFDSERKRMTTVHRVPPGFGGASAGPEGAAGGAVLAALRGVAPLAEAGAVSFTKGALDRVLETCTRVWTDERAEPLEETWLARIQRAHDELAAEGMRVLGLGFRPLPDEPALGGDDPDPGALERDGVFVGLLAMIDPPRPDVLEAVARCRDAGIRPIMITGDHPLTAAHIARELGIAADDRVLTGKDLASLGEAELAAAAAETSVFARVAPADKLHLVEALEHDGEVVAMTGDGVNDAPALKQAHVGVAMGVTGTDVAKEAADIVLLDDAFATIVNAVEEGRIVYDNIRRFVRYTMTSNAGEIWVMVLGPLLGLPLPLLPLQILWVNLVTDGLPGLALAIEPAEPGTMRRPAHPPKESIFARGMTLDILWVGLLMGAVSLLLGYWTWSTGGGAAGSGDDREWRTMVFTVLTLSQMGNALAVRSETESLFRIGLFSNRALLAAVGLTFALQMAVLYAPPLQAVFRTVPLAAVDLFACLALSTVVFWAVEAGKALRRRRAA